MNVKSTKKALELVYPGSPGKQKEVLLDLLWCDFEVKLATYKRRRIS